MRVGIDIDGVTQNFVSALTDRYVEWFGFPLAGQIRLWDDPLKLSHFKTYPDLFAWCDRAGVWDEAARRLIPGAAAGIDHLVDAGHSVVFTTSRGGGAVPATTRWHQTSLWAKATQLVTNLGDNKHSVPCSVYIDDSPKVIKALVDAGKNVVVFDQTWNRSVKVGHRATSWIEVIEIIEREPF